MSRAVECRSGAREIGRARREGGKDGKTGGAGSAKGGTARRVGRPPRAADQNRVRMPVVSSSWLVAPCVDATV
ncbi:hypothetical protein BTM_2010 [Burkholderia thailandensis 34]|nr:hypothetical protein BTL_329 [Burkholderia thailandensis H0587]AJY27676.1 hypothetical protein BTM_2010 [Burkholderia thailandensis 34]